MANWRVMGDKADKATPTMKYASLLSDAILDGASGETGM
jgi:hypothetical protein